MSRLRLLAVSYPRPKSEEDKVMAHPKRTTKKKRYRELATVPAGRARRRLITLSKKGVGRKAVHEFTGLDHRTLQRIKATKTKYVRKVTQELIFSVPFNAFCDRAVIDARPTVSRINRLLEAGFTRSELARRLNPKTKAKYKPGYASLQLGGLKVIARTEMQVKKLYDRIMAEAA